MGRFTLFEIQRLGFATKAVSSRPSETYLIRLEEMVQNLFCFWPIWCKMVVLDAYRFGPEIHGINKVKFSNCRTR